MLGGTFNETQQQIKSNEIIGNWRKIYTCCIRVAYFFISIIIVLKSSSVSAYVNKHVTSLLNISQYKNSSEVKQMDQQVVNASPDNHRHHMFSWKHITIWYVIMRVLTKGKVLMILMYSMCNCSFWSF